MLKRIHGITTRHAVIFLLLLGFFLRFYRLPQTMQFLGDQGRDALIVRRMLIEHHPALIGPVTSVGNMYLGPLYYYFMLFPLLLTYPDPSGPAYAVALVGVVTIWLLYRIGKETVGERAAVIAAALYAVSPLVLTFSRFSWNPNIVPFFSLLFFVSMYKAIRGEEKAWTFVGLWVAILIQLHYITLIFAAFAGCVWIWQLIARILKKKTLSGFLSATVRAIFVFILSLVPLIAFDVRHDYTNVRAFTAFFAGNGQHFRFLEALFGILTTSMSLAVRNIVGLFPITANDTVKPILFFFFTILVGISLRNRRGEHVLGRKLLVGLFLFSCIFLSLYRSTVYDHYLGFLYPLTSLLIGLMLSILTGKPGKLVVTVVVGILVAISLLHTPFKENLGYNIFMMSRTAEAIQAHVRPGETYDILVFTDTNDYQGMNYRYFLTTGKYVPASEEEIHSFKTLFILDEQNRANPIDGPQYKIAMWPNRTVIDRFDIPGGPRVFELRR